MKNKIIYWIAIIVSILYIAIGNKIAVKNLKTTDTETPQEYTKAEVISIEEEKSEQTVQQGNDYNNISDSSFTTFKIKAKLLSGIQKGTIINCTQTIEKVTSNTETILKRGDKILVIFDDMYNTGIAEWTYVDRLRSDGLIILGIIFLLFLLIFGKLKGVNTILSLGFTILSIFFVFIPAVLSGKNIYFWCILTCIYIIFSTLIIVYGINKKSISTVLGCIGGLLVSGILIIIMDRLLKLTGIVNEESIYLLFLNLENPINLKAILFASILIGAIGAIMDVAIDISSALNEISQKMKNPSFSELCKSGLTIGQDIMGTMTNTLILAYIGSSMSTVLLLAAYDHSLLSLFNKEMIVIEILQALIGSIGLLFTIPLTSIVSSVLHCNKKKSTDIFNNIKEKYDI